MDQLIRDTIGLQLHLNSMKREDGLTLSGLWKPLINVLTESRWPAQEWWPAYGPFLGPHSTDSCPMLLWQFLSPAPFFIRTLGRASLLSSSWSRITFIPPSSSPIDRTALLCVLVSSSPYSLPVQYVLIPQLIFHFLLSFLSSFSLGSVSAPCTSSQPMYWRWLHVAVLFYFRMTLVAPSPQPSPPPGQGNSISSFFLPSESIFSFLFCILFIL